MAMKQQIWIFAKKKNKEKAPNKPEIWLNQTNCRILREIKLLELIPGSYNCAISITSWAAVECTKGMN